MALFVHECFGHPAELDRALGSEASLAGGSYMQPELRGKLQVASPLVTITADGTLPRRHGLVRLRRRGRARAAHGRRRATAIFRDYLTSRESAGALGERSTGAARADGWARIPLVRMSNVSIEPGETPYEEIVASTKDGILVDMNRSVSIDDTRRNFRFGSEIGWEIRDGKLGRMLKNCTFGGRTLEFWPSCDAVADRDELPRLRPAVVQQGRAAAGRAHRPRHGARALPRRAGRAVIERLLDECGADHVEVLRERQELLRFGGSRITYQHSEEKLTVRARRGDALGDARQAGRRRAAGAARGRPRSPSLPQRRVTAAAESRVQTAFAATEEATPGRPRRASSARRSTRCPRGRGSAARSRTPSSSRRSRTPPGCDREERRTRALVQLVASQDGRSSYARGLHRDAAQLPDLSWVADGLVDLPLRPLEPGRYRAALGPQAMIVLAATLAQYAFHPTEGAFADRLGERVLGENVSIHDDGADPDGMPTSFDCAGHREAARAARRERRRGRRRPPRDRPRRAARVALRRRPEPVARLRRRRRLSTTCTPPATPASRSSGSTTCG